MLKHALRNIAVWIAMAFGRALVLLPWSWQVRIGASVAPLLERTLRRRRGIATRNLSICFPELDDRQRDDLAARHFRALGIAVAETSMAWWGSDSRVSVLSECVGREHVERALDKGRGAILVGAHFTTLEIMGRFFGQYFDVWASFRPLGIPGFDAAMRRGRLRGVRGLIPKEDYRGMLRCLNANGVLWLAADQAHTAGKPVEARFFGLPALTSIAIRRCAAATGCAILPCYCERGMDDRYILRIESPLDPFPGESALDDMETLNRHLEDAVRRVPEQYYWLHRRFKGFVDYEADAGQAS